MNAKGADAPFGYFIGVVFRKKNFVGLASCDL
jgi:hypothetical protein